LQLTELSINRVRCLRQIELAPGPGLNLVVGDNGSGKSSCLESIYLLGLGRSFRSRSVREVITFGEQDLLVQGLVMNPGGDTYSLGIERGARSRVRIAGKEATSASELARHLPILLITPESQRLLTDGTRLRRRLLDWALFHVEPSYFGVYQRYRQVLRQRNACLRQTGERRTIAAWDSELHTQGSLLHEMRERYINEARETVDGLVGSLLGRPIDIKYYAGWDSKQALGDVISANEASDRNRGFTGQGPHRADLRFKVDGAWVQNVLSRGESKLFIAAVLLAQTAHVMQSTGVTPVVLIDDLASELDVTNRQRLLSVIHDVGAQTFLTAVSGDVLPSAAWRQQKVFHVEQGLLQEVI
jgi:DNA replication and repair protein RecF